MRRGRSAPLPASPSGGRSPARLPRDRRGGQSVDPWSAARRPGPPSASTASSSSHCPSDTVGVPARSGKPADASKACPGEQFGDLARRRRRPPPAPAGRRTEHRRRGTHDRLVAPWPTSASTRLPVAHLRLERARSPPAGRRADWRRPDRTRPPARPRQVVARRSSDVSSPYARRSRAPARARRPRSRSRLRRGRPGARRRSPGRSRPILCRRRARAALSSPSISASARSTRSPSRAAGISARASVGQRQAPKAPLAEHVGERLARAAALARARARRPRSASVERAVVLDVELDAA